MHRAYQGIGRSPRDVDFVELHATGTAAGDPVETNWVGDKFKRNDELLIGSVKGNIGYANSFCLKVSSDFHASYLHQPFRDNGVSGFAMQSPLNVEDKTDTPKRQLSPSEPRN